MKERQKWKRRARHSLKANYGLWVVMGILLMVLSGEQIFTNPFSRHTTADFPYRNQMLLLSAYSDRMVHLLEDLKEGNIAQSREIAQQSIQKDVEDSSQTSPLGRSRGVFSHIVNRITSGSVLISLVVGISSIVGSDSLAVALLVVGGLLFFLLIWIFVINVFQVVTLRMFLEGMHYPIVHTNRSLYLLKTRTWTHVSFIMLRKTIFEMLWNLTIIGGIIKHYSYHLIPYIAAENPTIPAGEAMTLSRKMMNGHKWECFCLDLSFLGWEIGNLLTFGLLKALYLRPYQIATKCQYYSYLRQLCKQTLLAGTDRLCDDYLYCHPEKSLLLEVYRDVLPKSEIPAFAKGKMGAVKLYFAHNCGLFFNYGRAEKQYEAEQARLMLQQYEAEALNGSVYPIRLSPLAERNNRQLLGAQNPLRCYCIWSVILIFVFMSIVGWIWEVSLNLVMTGTFANRGMLHGPWVPIYGVGSVLVLMVLYRLRYNPMLEFTAAVLLSGIVEYATSWVTSQLYHQQWWDYSGYFLNLNGRICAEGLLVFGIGGLSIAYFIAPLLDNVIHRIPQKTVILLSIVLLSFFLTDTCYSARHPNEGDGITSIGTVPEEKIQA